MSRPPPYDRGDTEPVYALAQEWAWKGRSGDAKVQAAARVLTAVAWALTSNDGEALEELGAGAARYLAALRERHDMQLDPFVAEATNAYERLMRSLERELTGENNVAARQRAAQWFVIIARRDGFLLPALPADDKEAIAVLVEALGEWRRKLFENARDQSESWTRAMAEASGRKDAANAAKARMKKTAK